MKRTCPQCGVEFEAPTKRRVYCTKKCTWKARDIRRGDPCIVCGENVERNTRQGVPVRPKHNACRIPVDSSHFTHGIGGYERGCRCIACSQAKRAANRRWNGPPKRRVARSVRPGRRAKIPRDVRLLVYARDDFACQICFEPVDTTAETNADWAPTLDHVVPWSAGGDDSAANLRLAHRWCNSVRGDGKHYTEADLRAQEAATVPG